MQRYNTTKFRHRMTEFQGVLGCSAVEMILRDFEKKDLQNYVQAVPEYLRKQTNLSLKRFISFLCQSGRLDWGDAEDWLDNLKSPK